MKDILEKPFGMEPMGWIKTEERIKEVYDKARDEAIKRYQGEINNNAITTQKNVQ